MGHIMISGAHVIVYSEDAEADRVFFRDFLGLASFDAGRGWLIFALPPAEAAFHPAEVRYFLCSDLKAEMRALARKNAACSPVQEERWGSITRISLRVCDFFIFRCSLRVESSQEHLPTSIAGVLRLRAIKPSVCDRSAKRFAQDDGFVEG
jgi:hypothetical protein